MSVSRNLIKNILSNIGNIVQETLNVRTATYRKEVARQLKENGYDYFNGGKSTEAAHVIKILTLAIHDNLVENFKIQRLRTGNKHQVVDLGERLNVKGSVKNYLLKKETNWRSLGKAKSPLAFAEFLLRNGSDIFVKSLIEHQYKIKWATKGGRPEPFNFYKFCDNQQSEKYLQYTPGRHTPR